MPLLEGDSTLDDADQTWSVFGGYRFNAYIALEAGYTELGTAEYRAEGAVNPPGPVLRIPAALGMDFSAKGFHTAAIGSLPLGESFDLHAKVGVLYADSEVEIQVDIGNSSGSTEKLKGTELETFYGAGLSWFIADHWTLGLDYVRYKEVGKEGETNEIDIDSTTLQLGYRF